MSWHTYKSKCRRDVSWQYTHHPWRYLFSCWGGNAQTPATIFFSIYISQDKNKHVNTGHATPGLSAQSQGDNQQFRGNLHTSYAQPAH